MLAGAPRRDRSCLPEAAETTAACFDLNGDDVDATMAGFLAAGATLYGTDPAVEEAYRGDRVGRFVDPAGNVWCPMTAREAVAVEALLARLAVPTA